jgi:Reverse transcriptase (RNA-dependent DNA polymerase)
LDDFIVTYLNNIFIYSKNKKEYTSYIIKVLEALKRIELKINEKKSTFYQTEVEFLGYILTTTDIKINLKKIKAVLDWPTLITVKEI